MKKSIKITRDHDTSQRRKIRAFELREEGLKYSEIGAHPDIGPISIERSRQLVYEGALILERLYRVKEAEVAPKGPGFYERDPEKLNTTVDRLELSRRANNCLRNANISTLGELALRTDSDLIKTKNFGKKTLQEIKDVLIRIGLRVETEEKEKKTKDRGNLPLSYSELMRANDELTKAYIEANEIHINDTKQYLEQEMRIEQFRTRFQNVKIKEERERCALAVHHWQGRISELSLDEIRQVLQP